jgi:RHS repeat-associated protein
VSSPVQSSDGFYYLHSDHLGSTSLLTYGNGQANPGTKVSGSETRYYPYGAQRGTPPTQSITDRNFTGQKENLEIGMLYYNARFYLPNTNRFLTPDSIVPDPTNPQSYNRYSYVRNNPLMFIDPTGHSECGVGQYICDDDYPTSPTPTPTPAPTATPTPDPITQQLLASTVQIRVGSYPLCQNRVRHFPLLI